MREDVFVSLTWFHQENINSASAQRAGASSSSSSVKYSEHKNFNRPFLVQEQFLTTLLSLYIFVEPVIEASVFIFLLHHQSVLSFASFVV